MSSPNVRPGYIAVGVAVGLVAAGCAAVQAIGGVSGWMAMVGVALLVGALWRPLAKLIRKAW